MLLMSVAQVFTSPFCIRLPSIRTSEREAPRLRRFSVDVPVAAFETLLP